MWAPGVRTPVLGDFDNFKHFPPVWALVLEDFEIFEISPVWVLVCEPLYWKTLII